ncbi:hypothetical protein D3C81_2265120 [compost metagenome]
MQGSGHRQAERGDGGIEMFAIASEHLVSTLHGADFGGHYGPAAVGMAFTRLDQRLLANHARTTNLLDMSIAIGDDPVP